MAFLHTRRTLRRNRLGLTLVELMIAVALIGIGIIAAAASFKGIHRSIQFSKGRMLATNIAQEKVQVLMQKSYYEVLVTTAPAYIVAASSTIAYDIGYFPPEQIKEGGILFTRYTYIQVAQENSGFIQTLPPDIPDTGMRQIRETVIWNSDGADHFLTVQNVLNNPSTVMSNAALNGTVTDAVTGTAIPNGLVNAAENIGWRDNTNALGNYAINLSAGYFNFQASAPGYYSKIIPLTIAPNSTTSQAFSLTPISSGTISGSAWIDNHLVISQVVSSTGPANGMEYVELYNPSTGTIVMGTNVTYATANVWAVAFDASGGSQPRPELVYISTYIPPNGYYLISNTGDGGGVGATIACAPVVIAGVAVNPDACWRYAGMPNHLLQCANLPGGGGGCGASVNAGGIGLGTNGGLVWTGLGNATKIDSLAWAGSGTTPASYESSPAIASTALGMGTNEDFIRRLDTGTSWNSAVGNAYDSDNNNVDFINTPVPFPPRTKANICPPRTGTPAVGTIVSVIDGLSVPSSATLVGSPPYAKFSIPGVATGTWTVFLDSTSASAEADNVAVVGNSTTSIGNMILSTTGVIGMISGRVTDALGPAIGGLTMTAGSYSTTTGANGTYYFRMSTGIYTVTANPGNMNPIYAVAVRPNVNVTLADVTNNVDLTVSKGGKISGWVSRDGINPLPGVTVIALDSNGDARDSEVSGNNGQFLLINLTTGTYTVDPVLDPKEVSSPATTSISVTPGNTVWSGTFTVTGAMGSVAGNVTVNGAPISSGVLVIVSTGGLTLPLPTLSSATLTSGAYYANSSKEDGSFSVDVRSSTTTLYTATAFYMYLNDQTPIISSRTVSGLTINGGTTTSGVNFAW